MILECTKGHKWNTSFDISYSDLIPDDSCPLPIKYNKRKNPSVILCGLPLKKVIHKRKEKKKSHPKGRIPQPYNRSKIKREGKIKW